MQKRYSHHIGGVLLGLLLLGLSTFANAQQSSKNDTCRQWFTNRSGVAGAPITVSTAAITVVATNQRLCGALILNFSEADTILCRSIAEGAPTATVGFPVTAGGFMGLDWESQRGVQCIRAADADNDAVVYVVETEP